jgi:hypothetical protein
MKLSNKACEGLMPHERIVTVFNALGRKDLNEAERVAAGCRTVSYKGYEPAYATKGMALNQLLLIYDKTCCDLALKIAACTAADNSACVGNYVKLLTYHIMAFEIFCNEVGLDHKKALLIFNEETPVWVVFAESFRALVESDAKESESKTAYQKQCVDFILEGFRSRWNNEL